MEMSQNIRDLDQAAQRYFHEANEESLRNVIDSATGLIYYYVNLYGKKGDKDDLFQTGCLGVLKALKNYDSCKGASFLTYASHCIKGEIRHAVRKQAAYDRPGCIIELQYKINQLGDEYMKTHGEKPSVQYIAKQLNVNVEGVMEVMRAGIVSFEEIDINKIRSSSYESFRLPIEDKLTIYQAIKKLTDLQQKIIYMLFYQDMSQQQIAEKLGLTQKKVSRIKESSLQRMQKYLQGEIS